MEIPLPERGNYYRGLLVLIKQDRTVDERERELLIRVGEVLDFDKRFCEAAINDLMKNKHILEEPVRFSDRSIAVSFLRDAIQIAFVDGELHSKELKWLKAVADANGLDSELLNKEIAKLQKTGCGAGTLH